MVETATAGRIEEGVTGSGGYKYRDYISPTSAATTDSIAQVINQVVAKNSLSDEAAFAADAAAAPIAETPTATATEPATAPAPVAVPPKLAFSKSQSSLGKAWNYMTGEDLRQQRELFVQEHPGALDANQVDDLVKEHGRGREKLSHLKIDWNDLQRIALKGAEHAQKNGGVASNSDVEAMAEELMKSKDYGSKVSASQKKILSLGNTMRAAGNVAAGGIMGGVGGALIGLVLSPFSLITKPIALCIDKTFGTNLAPKAGPVGFIGGLAVAGAALLGFKGAHGVYKMAMDRKGSNDAVRDVYKAALMQGIRNVSNLDAPPKGHGEGQAPEQVQAQSVHGAQQTTAKPAIAQSQKKSGVLMAAQEIVNTFDGMNNKDVQMRVDFLKYLLEAKSNTEGKSPEDHIKHGIAIFKKVSKDVSKNPQFDAMLDAINAGDHVETKARALLVKDALLNGGDALSVTPQTMQTPAAPTVTIDRLAAITERLATAADRLADSQKTSAALQERLEKALAKNGATPEATSPTIAPSTPIQGGSHDSKSLH